MRSILIETGSVRLEKISHLVDKRTCAAGTDTVHTLLNISFFEVNDLRVLAAKLDCHVSLWAIGLQAGGDSDNFLYERYAEMLCQCKSA